MECKEIRISSSVKVRLLAHNQILQAIIKPMSINAIIADGFI